MPRLPGPEALGGLPSMRGGQAAQISGRDPVAEGLGRLGQGMVALSEDQRQREDALQAAEADAELTTRLTDLRRRFDTDPEWRTFQPRFEEEANRIRTEAAGRITNPRTRERWMPRADVAVSGAFDHVRGRQDRLRGEHEFDRLDSALGQLGTSYVNAPDDASRDTIRRNMEETIELGRRTGVVSAERIRDLTRRRLYGAIEADLQTRHSVGDGYAALLELAEGDARTQQPSTGQLSELGFGQIQAQQPHPAGQSAQARAAADRRLRNDAAKLSEWITGNVTVPLTQIQHDALVGIGIRRGRDALAEMLPTVNAGNWEATAGTVRAGGIFAQETAGGRGTLPAPVAPVEFTPLPAGLTPPPANPRAQPVRGIILHHSGGTSLEGAMRYNYVVGRNGEVYEVAPAGSVMPHVQPRDRDAFGMRSRNGQFPHLTSGTTIGVAALAENNDDIQPVQREAMVRLVRQLAAEHGIPASEIIGHGDIQAGAQGRYGRSASEGTLAREFREGRVSLTGDQVPAAPADARTEEMADMLLGQAPSSRYRDLPPDRRRVLLRRLRENLVNEAHREIESDLESIRRTGEARRLPDGTTWIERANRILVPNQAARVTTRVQEAVAEFRALEGLPDMTPDQMELRLDELSPGRVGDGESYAIAARVRDRASRAIGRIQELRQRDPALAVSGTQISGGRGRQVTDANGQLYNVPAEDDLRVRPAQEVAAAFQILQRSRPDLRIISTPEGTILANPPQTGQHIDPQRMRPQTLLLTDPRLTPDERRLIIEARLAAMARLGIPEHSRPILRRDEAAALLNMPMRDTDMTDNEFGNRRRAAADRARQLFGSYATAALEAAFEFRTMSPERRKDAEFEINKIRPEPDREGYLRERALRQLAQEEAMWRGGEGVTDDMGLAFPLHTQRLRPAAGVRPNLSRVGMGGQTTTVAPGTVTSRRYPKPPPEEVQYLMQHPQIWEEFEKDYGPGSAAQHLQEGWRGAY